MNDHDRPTRHPGCSPHPPPGFTVTATRPAAGLTVLDVAGELDMATSPLLAAHLEQHLRAPGATDLIVDLRHLDFLSAHGVRAVLAADREARAHGVRLQLVIAQRRPARLFALLGLDRHLALRSDLETARRHAG